ncbi:MAG: hemolysin D [Porticoccaceae bacterium]|nr:MAG: hemolysin D [Porticoccaceae bacterium]
MTRRQRNLALMFGVPALGVALLLLWHFATARFVATENAYVKRDKVAIAPEVSGRIVEVAVEENQHVAAGQLLFRIDPEPYRLAVAEAEAALAAARAQVEALQAALATAQVKVQSARTDVEHFEREYRRQRELARTRATSEVTVRAAEHELSQARARLAEALAEEAEARAALATGEEGAGALPAVRLAEVRLERARLDLARTAVRAPAAGVVSQADRLQVGQLLMANLAALTLVKDRPVWVEANFKETELTRMRPGQPARIRIDAYPDLELKGRVASIGAGTGAEFSLLPPQNTSANWVKVTQRVPVRIALAGRPPRPLIAGLSAHVRVDTRD